MTVDGFEIRSGFDFGYAVIGSGKAGPKKRAGS